VSLFHLIKNEVILKSFFIHKMESLVQSLPQELISKIMLYTLDSPHNDLEEEIFKRLITKPIYQKMNKKEGLFKDARGHITKIYLWYENPHSRRHPLNMNILDVELHDHIDFDITLLQKFPNLTKLDLSYTNIYGDIAVLKWLPNLTKLNLAYAYVSGDIAVLRWLPNLTDMDIGSTGVMGDIAVLYELPNLTKYFLDDTNVTGDSVKCFNKLWHAGLISAPRGTVVADIPL